MPLALPASWTSRKDQRCAGSRSSRSCLRCSRSAAPAGAEDLTQTLPVARPGRLRIELDRGSVDVLTHPESSVHVEATAHGLGASSVAFEVVREGDDVVLRARTEAWIDWLSSGPRLSVQVLIPPRSRS